MKTLRKRLKKWLYTSCPPFAGAFPYFGTKVYFPKNSLIFAMVCREGIFEQTNINLLQSLVKPKSLYFDIGANIGLMAIPILKHLDTFEVVSFEPSPYVFPFLKRTVENSSFRNRWRVIRKALGAQAGVSEFFTSNSGYEAYSSFRNTQRADTQIKIDVPVTTLDVEWEALGRPAVSVIKIDVEGAELQVLQGAIECIKHEKPYILVEWNTTNFKAYHSTPEHLLKFAGDIEYQVFSILESSPNHPPFHLIPVVDPINLKIQMMSTENFLLVPKRQNERQF